MASLRRNRSSTAVAIESTVRCAVYTRKSTDEGLASHFNSLDNQRERAEAYASSQENWNSLPDRYDDGGFSGGNTERPALRRLLADAQAGRFETVIVYRLDRISRSLRDFLGIHEFLEERGIALVSVTESINTSTPHGRMMVNVLLSFAQYERELAAERTRHKIEAARRRGQWTGGAPPLGYDVVPEGGKIVVNTDEAKQAVAIFELYAEKPSLVKVTQELNRRGWRQKAWIAKTGNRCGGAKWNKVSLRSRLTDPLYIGKQKLGDEVFPGEHKAIVPRKLFDRVQRLMDENRTSGGASTRNRYGALLRGLLRCAACDRAMTHTTTKTRSRAHRYYTCQRAQKEGRAACPTKSIPAGKVETFVVDHIRRIGVDATLQEETFQQTVAQVKAQRRGLRAEKKRLTRDLTTARANAQLLVETVARVSGSAADAVAVELATAQERFFTIETRLAEIGVELDALKAQVVDRHELAQALEAFDPIWDVLLTSEKERVVNLLIERIDYDGGTREFGIKWRLAGFGQLAAEVAP